MHARLYSLWRLATATVPEVALDPASNRVRDLKRVRGSQLLLYRRIVELRDVELGLAGYGAPGAGSPHGSSRSAGRRAPSHARSRRCLHARRARHAGTPDLTLHEEALWWLDVAQALRKQQPARQLVRRRQGQALETR